MSVFLASHAGSELGKVFGNIIIVTGSFILLFVLIRIFAWDKITGIFEKRAQYINEEIERAEKAKIDAEALVAKRQKELDNVRKEADSILLEAKKTGDAMKQRLLAEAEKQVEALKEKAVHDTARHKAEALASMKDDVSTMSLDLAQQILMKELDPHAQSQLIDRYLEKLGE